MVNDEAKQSVIQFEDVSFEYPGAETESIQPGERETIKV